MKKGTPNRHGKVQNPLLTILGDPCRWKRMNTSTWQSRLDNTAKWDFPRGSWLKWGLKRKLKRNRHCRRLLVGHFSCYFSRKGSSLKFSSPVVSRTIRNLLSGVALFLVGARISHTGIPAPRWAESVPLKVWLQSIFGNMFALENRRNEIKYWCRTETCLVGRNLFQIAYLDDRICLYRACVPFICKTFSFVYRRRLRRCVDDVWSKMHI